MTSNTTDSHNTEVGRRNWGPWRLDASTRVLYPVGPDHYRYEIDLDTCTTSAEVLDWICQIAGKNWADDGTLAGLVRALDDVLHPQANLCSSGKSKRLTVSQIARRVAAAVDDAAVTTKLPGSGVSPCVDCGRPVTTWPPEDGRWFWRCGRCGRTPTAMPARPIGGVVSTTTEEATT